MALNPYIPPEHETKREYAKLKPKWVPKSKKKPKQKPLRPDVSPSQIQFRVWSYRAWVDEVTTVTGQVKALTAAAAGFSAGQAACKTYSIQDLVRLEVWDAEAEIPSTGAD